MSWANIKELIFQERKLLDTSTVPDFLPENAFETQHSALLASYLRTKPNVDAVIISFAQTLEWPEMTPLERFFVNARLDFAWEIACVLNTTREGEMLIAYPASERSTTAQLLEWLLVEIWPYGCSRFLQSQRWQVEQTPIPRKQPTRGMPEVANASCVA